MMKSRCLSQLSCEILVKHSSTKDSKQFTGEKRLAKSSRFIVRASASNLESLACGVRYAHIPVHFDAS